VPVLSYWDEQCRNTWRRQADLLDTDSLCSPADVNTTSDSHVAQSTQHMHRLREKVYNQAVCKVSKKNWYYFSDGSYVFIRMVLIDINKDLVLSEVEDDEKIVVITGRCCEAATCWYLFLPARRLLARYLLQQRGWLVVTRRYCIKTAKPILKLFRPSGSPSF